MSIAQFLVKDTSGRGETTTLSAADVLASWDGEYKNNPDDQWQESLAEWLESADVGSTFTHAESNVTFTRIQ